jgi:hypothetical protein
MVPGMGREDSHGSEMQVQGGTNWRETPSCRRGSCAGWVLNLGRLGGWSGHQNTKGEMEMNENTVRVGCIFSY